MMREVEGPNIRRTEYDVHPDVVMGVTQVDDRPSAASPRHALAQVYGLDDAMVHVVRQVHGNVVVEVGATHDDTIEADAMITLGTPGLLAVKVADCCPILLYDTATGAMGAVHSGWRGTHVRIAVRAIEAMQRAYGTRAQDLVAVLGPCASGERYEVRADVADLFPGFVRPVREGVWTFDNRAAIVDQLLGSGVDRSKIQIDPSDTLTDSRFHSHRRDGAAAGRSLAYVGAPFSR